MKNVIIILAILLCAWGLSDALVAYQTWEHKQIYVFIGIVDTLCIVWNMWLLMENYKK